MEKASSLEGVLAAVNLCCLQSKFVGVFCLRHVFVLPILILGFKFLRKS